MISHVNYGLKCVYLSFGFTSRLLWITKIKERHMNAHSKYGRKCNKNNDDCDDYHNLALLHTLLLLFLNIHSSLLDLIRSFLISVAASFSIEFSNTLLISGERRQKTKMKNSKFVFLQQMDSLAYRRQWECYPEAPSVMPSLKISWISSQ